MTPEQALAAIVAPAGLAIALVLSWPAVRRTGLGIVHPTIVWLAFHGLFFAAGAVILTASGEIRADVDWYVAGTAVAVGLATWASDRVAEVRRAQARRAAARRLGQGAAPDGSAVDATPVGAPVGPPEVPPVGLLPGPVDPAPVRPVVVAALVVIAVAAISPQIVGHGLPLLSPDPTGARVELTGIPVQIGRIAIPAAAIALLVAAFRRPDRRRVAVAVAGVAIAVTFTILLASRYLVAELVAALAIAWLLAGRRLAVRWIAAVALAAAVVFGGVQIIRAPVLAQGREFAFAAERTVSRVLLVQPRTLNALMEVIPAETPYFGGATWFRRVSGDAPNLGYWIYPRVFPNQLPGPPGYAAPGLIGEAWANFGPAGLILFALLGVLLERLGALAAIRRSGTGDLAALSIAILVLGRTHALGLNGAALLAGLIVAWRVLAARGLGDLADDVRRALAWRL